MSPSKTSSLIVLSMLAVAGACGDAGSRRTIGDAGPNPDAATGETDAGGGDDDAGGGETDAGGDSDAGMTDGGCADDDGDGVCNDADACEGSDDALDADSDGVPDGCDACDGSDDALDADADGVPDGCDLCAGSSPRILLYDGNSRDHKGQSAIELVGCPVIGATRGGFVTELETGFYDVVVFDAPSNLPSGDWQDTLETFVQGGGGAIVSTFTGGWASGVSQMLGVTTSTAHTTPVPFEPRLDDPVFDTPFDVTSVSFAPSTEDPWSNNGHVLTSHDGAVYARFADGNAIVRSNGGRTFANGFLLDDYDDDEDGDGHPDIVELVANQLVAVVQSIRNEMYALPYDYFAWDDASADLLARAIELRWFETPWDELRVVGMVSECADTVHDTNSTTTPGGPYMGEYHATVAAAEHGGIDSARIVRFATAAEADSAIGTYDVLVFTEPEDCNRNATTWDPIVTEHIHRGGRVVFTTPRGGQAQFVDDLRRFGSGSMATDNAPFSTVSDPFWSGLTHPGALNGTDAWSWSGPGLEILGQDSNGDETVWRYITVATPPIIIL